MEFWDQIILLHINGPSPLMKIDHFQLGNFQIPQDVMHVVFEGVLNTEVRLMLASFLSEEELFSVDLLNDRILHFDYGRGEGKDKPPKPFQVANFTSANKLHLSGISLIMCDSLILCKLSLFSCTDVDFCRTITADYWRQSTGGQQKVAVIPVAFAGHQDLYCQSNFS